MRKLFLVLVAIFLVASSAYAWVETENNGPQNETTCYAIGTTGMVSGNVVVLSTTSATRTVEFPGREVTGTTTQGSDIYGVVVSDATYTPAEMVVGRYIKVRTYGYCPIIKITTSSTGAGGATAVGDGLSTSALVFRAALNGTTGGRVTGSVVAFSAMSAAQDSGTVTGFIRGGL